MKNSTVNKFIARKYLYLANKNEEYSQLECDKIEYVIKVLLSEVEKILVHRLYTCKIRRSKKI